MAEVSIKVQGLVAEEATVLLVAVEEEDAMGNQVSQGVALETGARGKSGILLTGQVVQVEVVVGPSPVARVTAAMVDPMVVEGEVEATVAVEELAAMD